jgi:sigma-B regulation protein RsbU (phosphoserine phosphatase)
MILKNIFYNASILVVEDDLINLKILLIHLEKAGYTNIRTARDGMEALEEVKREKPDLIILDLIMPKMDGYEVIRHLRTEYHYQDLPIIVQTALDNVSEQQKAWELGATDLIHKPIHKLELLSRVNIHLTQHTLFNELSTFKNIANEDIKNALALQLSLLPNSSVIKSIRKKYKIDIDSIFKPSRFLSGDIWGAVPIDDDSFGLWLCDFSGKGIKAALNTFRLHTIFNNPSLDYKSPSSVLKAVNQSLHKFLQVGNFSTSLYGVMNIRNKTFRYSSASQPAPILYDRKNGTFDLCESRGLPLGINENTEYEEHVTPLKEDQSLIFYSDALFETEDDLGFSFEADNLPYFFTQLKGKNVVPYVNMIIDSLDNDDFSVADDFTLIEFSYSEK